MNQYHLSIESSLFESNLIFKNGVDGLVVHESILSRKFNPIIFTKSLQVTTKEKPSLNEVEKISNFLNYLIRLNIGEFAYLEINFDSIIFINKENKRKIFYNFSEILNEKRIMESILLNKYDKKIILSTLSREPLTPQKKEDLLFNNQLLDRILSNTIKNFIKSVNFKNLILTGDIIWSDWSGLLGKILILKTLPLSNNYNVYLDKSGLWKGISSKRDKEKWLYKITSSIFIPDILFINSLKFEKDRKIELEGINKQYIVEPDRFTNILKYTGDKFPETIIINNTLKRNIKYLKDTEINTYLLKEKNQISIKGNINTVELKKSSEFKIFSQSKIDINLKHDTFIDFNQVLGNFSKSKISIEKINTSKFISECVEGQLVHKGDIIGVEKNTFSNIPIYAKQSGKLSMKYLGYGYILIEDNVEKEFKSHIKGIFKYLSNKEELGISTDYLNIPLAYQMGENIYAENIKKTKNSFSIYKYLNEYDPIGLSVKEIIENNIKLIIIRKGDLPQIKNFFKENPILNDFLSCAIIGDNLDKAITIIDNIFEGNIINGISLENGNLKLICDFDSNEYRKLKELSEMMPKNLVKVLKYERGNNYGIILKSLSSTDKLVKFTQVESIENSSNLINLSFKL